MRRVHKWVALLVSLAIVTVLVSLFDFGPRLESRISGRQERREDNLNQDVPADARASQLPEIERLRLPAADPPEGSLAVLVLDHLQRPVAGAHVFIRHFDHPRDLPDSRRAQLNFFDDGTRRIGTTGQDGIALVPSASDRRTACFIARSPAGDIGWVNSVADGSSEAARTLIIQFVEGRELLVTIVAEETGLPIQGALLVVQWNREHSGTQQVALATQEEGSATLTLPISATEMLCTADHPEFTAASSALLSQPFPRSVLLRMRSGARVNGRVVSSQGQPLPGVRVSAWPQVGADVTGATVADLSLSASAKQDVTAEDGTFLIQGLSTADFYCVGAVTSAGTCLVRSATISEEVTVIVPAAVTIAGKIVPQADVSECRVSAISTKSPRWPPTAMAQLESSGEFRVDVLPGEYGLIVWDGLTLGFHGPILAADDTPVGVLQNSPGWAANIQPSEGSQYPHESAWVSVDAPVGLPTVGAGARDVTWRAIGLNLLPDLAATLRSDAQDEFKGLPEGLVRFRIQVPGLGAQHIQHSGKAGEQAEIQLDPPQGGSLWLTVHHLGQPLAGVSLVLRPTATRSPIVPIVGHTSGAGTLFVPRLVAGEWSLYAGSPQDACTYLTQFSTGSGENRLLFTLDDLALSTMSMDHSALHGQHRLEGLILSALDGQIVPPTGSNHLEIIPTSDRTVVTNLMAGRYSLVEVRAGAPAVWHLLELRPGINPIILTP